MSEYERTGVVVTEDERKELVDLVQTARSTPVMGLSSSHMSSGGFSGDAWSRFYRRLHEVAQAHGLPEITGQYGLDGQSGEILAPPGQR